MSTENLSAAIVPQKVLRPRKLAINVAKVFVKQAYLTDRIAGLAGGVESR